MKPIRRARIITHIYFDAQGKNFNLGGVEIYLRSMAKMLLREGWEVLILQRADALFSREDDGIRVQSWLNHKELTTLLREMNRREPAVTVYSDFRLNPPRMEHPSVAIQHGLAWDDPFSAKEGWLYILRRFRAMRRYRKLINCALRVTRQADRMICADTNYPNWLQATYRLRNWAEKVIYIPNFSEVPDLANDVRQWDGSQRIQVVFARRFDRFRGTLMFGSIVKDLVPKYPQVDFKFFGAGPLESKLREMLAGVKNVSIKRLTHDELMQEHLKTHIVVVPTLAAEATSLSCVEAMASRCAVVITRIGGLADLVLPCFNGLLCEPTKAAVRESLEQLLNNLPLAQSLAQNARAVVESSFTLEIWEKRILRVLTQVADGVRADARIE